MLSSIFTSDLEALVPRLRVGDSIPHVIYQTYSDSSLLSDSLSGNIAYLKQMNPDWQYCLYSDADVISFIKSEYPALLVYFQRISPVYGAARADFFRYLLIYRYGGVYLDIKSTITKPLTSTIKVSDQFLLGNWTEWQDTPGYKGWGKHTEVAHVQGGEFQQWYIVSVAGHPYLRAVILNMLRNIAAYHPRWFGVGKLGVLRTTGPIAYTLAIAPIRKADDPGLVQIKSDYGFEYSIYEKDVHLGLFSRHYSTNSEPIILKNRYEYTISFLVGLVKKIRKRLRK